MKKVSVVVVCALLVISAAVPAQAANWRKGKKIFKSVCLECHDSGGKAEKLSPTDLTQAQWRRYFVKDQHKALPEVWKDLNQKQLDDLQQYLIKYAADADKPGTCG